MKFFNQFAVPAIAHVTLQLSNEEYASLREWMHAPDGEMVEFLHGVKLQRRGFGWYRMVASNDNRVVDKLTTSMAVVRKWYKFFQEKRNQELRVLLAASAPNAKVASYHSENDAFTVVNMKTGVQQTITMQTPKLASAGALHSLVNKFGNRSARR